MMAIGPEHQARAGKAWWLWPLMLLAGVAQAFSLAWPWGGEPLWWLQLLSLSVLCVGVQRAHSAKQVAWLAGLFATAAPALS